MNTISNSQNTLDVYALRRIQEAKAVEQSKVQQRQRQQDENDSISISQQALQTTQASKSVSPLDNLVTAGTITQDQADAVQSIFQSRGKEIQSSGTYSNRTKPQNPLDSLVTSGTITQDEADAIDSAFKALMEGNKTSQEQSTNTRTNPLYSLVTAGTITEEQENSIQKALEAGMNFNRF